MKVYVISNKGHPLKPCSHAIARFLLKIKRAEVVSKEPFTKTDAWKPPRFLGCRNSVCV